jgi:hypothetical protein
MAGKATKHKGELMLQDEMPTAKKHKAAPQESEIKGAAAGEKDTDLYAQAEYTERVERVMQEHGCEKSILIVGIDDGETQGEDDDGEDKAVTAEELARVRHVLINKSRETALMKALDFCTCGQATDDGMWFNTSSGNKVCQGIPCQVQTALRKKLLPQRFDALFALTRGLQRYNFWMHDNACHGKGGDLECAVKALAKAWRILLKNSDKDLGIDPEFTRPGIEALLSKLEHDLASCEVTAEFEFKWR